MARPVGANAPSQRQLRVGELVRHALAEILSRGEVPEPALERTVITVSEVRTSPDLKVATAFVMPLGGRDQQSVLTALRRHAKYLRGELARRVELRSVPELRFEIDTSFDQGQRMDTLLNDPAVRRDVESAPDITDEPDA
jgi:ribosome-binding factor A